jgi:hypothetical protein
MIDIIYEKTIPSTGAITIKSKILVTPATITELKPLPAIAAPTNPPTSVWDELDGSPSHQVIRFQIIAATTADAINVNVIISE